MRFEMRGSSGECRAVLNALLRVLEDGDVPAPALTVDGCGRRLLVTVGKDSPPLG